MAKYDEKTLKRWRENRKKWIKALESGEYKKARGRLKNSKGGMCCLGVLATLAGCKNIAGGVAPVDAMDFVGLTSYFGSFASPYISDRNLVDVNDTTKGFDTVIEIIKKSPPGLFREN